MWSYLIYFSYHYIFLTHHYSSVGIMTRDPEYYCRMNYRTRNNTSLMAAIVIKCIFVCFCPCSPHSPHATPHPSYSPSPDWYDMCRGLCSVFPHLPLTAPDAPHLPGSRSHPANTPPDQRRKRHSSSHGQVLMHSSSLSYSYILMFLPKKSGLFRC